VLRDGARRRRGHEAPVHGRVSRELAARGIATLRYEFPLHGARIEAPDTPAVAQARVREAVEEAARRAPQLPLFAGGKSFGGRMTSQAQAKDALPGVKGLVFFGFPLHAPGKASDERAQHLADVTVPMLFLQGTRDDFASLDLLRPMVERLGKRATLELFEDADHSFHVPARTGRKDAQVLSELADAAAGWIREKG
jgi:predicted alpha/beta-hydrolase family hydrolase